MIDPDENELHRVVGFGNDELFPLLNGKTHLRVDDAFLCVPCPFTQVIVSMIHDEKMDMHAPILNV